MTLQSGVGEATLPFVGFGAAFLDYDNDMDLDLAIANGDVDDNVERLSDTKTFEQKNLLLENNGAGKFTDAGPDSGPGFAARKPSRALAVGDLDNDWRPRHPDQQPRSKPGSAPKRRWQPRKCAAGPDRGHDQ